jgi:hypothetical protein
MAIAAAAQTWMVPALELERLTQHSMITKARLVPNGAEVGLWSIPLVTDMSRPVRLFVDPIRY